MDQSLTINQPELSCSVRAGHFSEVIAGSGFLLGDIMKALDLSRQRFGRLEVIKRKESNISGKAKWLCRCDCGNMTIVFASNLKKRNGTKSCGCLWEEAIIKHGYSRRQNKNTTYNSWYAMIQRCNNPNNLGYKWYGGRRIKVCEHWNKFENFLEDMGERPVNLTLERKDNDGNYEPGNCKWATHSQQRRNNRRTPILNEAKAHIIKKLLLESTLKQTKIAQLFKVKPSVIQDIRRGRSWVNVK